MTASPESRRYQKLVGTHEGFLRRLYDLTYHIPLLRSYESKLDFGPQVVPNWYGMRLPLKDVDMLLEQAHLFEGRHNNVVLALGRIRRYEWAKPTLGLEVGVFHPELFQLASPEDLRSISTVRDQGVFMEVSIDPRYLRPDLQQPEARPFLVEVINEVLSYGGGLHGFYNVQEIDNDNFRGRWLRRVEAALLTA